MRKKLALLALVLIFMTAMASPGMGCASPAAPMCTPGVLCPSSLSPCGTITQAEASETSAAIPEGPSVASFPTLHEQTTNLPEAPPPESYA